MTCRSGTRSMRRCLPLAAPPFTACAMCLSAISPGRRAPQVRAPFYDALSPALILNYSRRTLPDDLHTLARPIDAPPAAVVRPTQAADNRRRPATVFATRASPGSPLMRRARCCARRTARLSHHNVRISSSHIFSAGADGARSTVRAFFTISWLLPRCSIASGPCPRSCPGAWQNIAMSLTHFIGVLRGRGRPRGVAQGRGAVMHRAR